MDYLKILHEKPDLADEFDSLFDFFLLDELLPLSHHFGKNGLYRGPDDRQVEPRPQECKL